MAQDLNVRKLLHRFYVQLIVLTDFECPDFEIYSNGRDIWGTEGVFHKSNKYTSLPYTAISYQQKPEQVVVVFRHVL